MGTSLVPAWELDDPRLAEGLRQNKPIHGSFWKFKLFSYAHRTHLLRNLGKELAHHRDYHQYITKCKSLLSTWGAPIDVFEGVSPLLQNWARAVLDDSELAKELLAGRYIERAHAVVDATFNDQSRASKSKGAVPPKSGLYVIFSVHPVCCCKKKTLFLCYSGSTHAFVEGSWPVKSWR
mmetsp:Transcript_17622/g.48880  ORF Transcript_17622/g.48880 Transcript_17622/m.48880 type:complete len:179 (-) Transcript_17622:3399-3935(-)